MNLSSPFHSRFASNKQFICDDLVEDKAKLTHEIHGKSLVVLKPTSNATEEKNRSLGPNDDLLLNMNAFQRFIAHEDFGLFILLASKVKIIRKNLLSGTVPNQSDVITITHIQSRKGVNEANVAGKFIQSTLLLGPDARVDIKSLAVPRGTFKITDDLMKESIISLAREFNRCMTWYNALRGQSLPKSPSRKRMKLNDDQRGNIKANDAIAVKYSKYQTDILTNWMIAHKVSVRFWVFGLGFKTYLHI